MTRVGVVGCGGIGGAHLRAYADAGTPAVAVTDVDADRAAAVAVEHGVTAYPDLPALLGAVDAVSIGTPPSAHAEAAIAALEAGVAVLCEKPMAISVAECEQMLAVAARTGTLLMVGFCHRYQPEIEAMREAIARGDIGAPLAFRNRFAGPLTGVENRWFSRRAISGGGVLMDTCAHSVDLFRYLVGEVADVRALTATTATSLGPALEVEDTTVLSLRAESGVLGVIEASWRTRPGEAVVHVEGTDGALIMDYQSLQLTRRGPDGAVAAVDVSPNGAISNRFTRQAAHFLACVRGEEKPRVTGEDGAAAMRVLAAAYESAS